MIECYRPRGPLGRRFAYYVNDRTLDTDKGKATRFANRYLAQQKMAHVRRHIPPGFDWVRVCPA